jgi:SAM-dependent methyltransferase
MNKDDVSAVSLPAASPETGACPKQDVVPLVEAPQGRDPTLKWCIPDLAANPASPAAPQPPVRDPAFDQVEAAMPKASEAVVEGVTKVALPEAIQGATPSTISPRSDSFEIVISEGPTETGDAKAPETQREMAPTTPPPRREVTAVTPPPRLAELAVTPPPIPVAVVATPPDRREMEGVTPPPRPAKLVAAPTPKPVAVVVTPPPRLEIVAVTPSPKPETVAAIPSPRPEAVTALTLSEPATSPRVVGEIGVTAARGGDASGHASLGGATTGATPEAAIRMAETGEVGDGDFEVMEPGDTPSSPSSTASTPPPVPVMAGTLGAAAQPLQPGSPSEADGSVGDAGAAALAREALPLPEALSRRPLKRSLKPWFEEVFDEDYLRTLPFMTAQQTLRETAFIKDALSAPAEGEVLDIACGYGRHAIEFGQRGYRVTGLDLSLPLLIRAADEAQRRNLSVNFVHADMREMAYDSQFDAAYCVLTSFGYFDEETNLRVASSICRAIKPGGRFLVDTINRDYIVSDLPSRTWWEGDGCVVLEEVDFNFHTSRVLIRRSIVFGDGRQVENEISIRAYSLHELGRVLRRAGFQILEASGSLANKEPFLGASSRHVVLVCERPLP